ncbi:MAG: class I SAM-dependent methyltransferase, partial [Planctomycetaceae bacterium]|nr:class I SAM-dependent methyltransferase [Planctomycetaceae bacterium]
MSAVASSSQPQLAPHSANCPACGTVSEARQAWRFINVRGEAEWLQCPACRSYFLDHEYSVENEVTHTKKMIWGDTTDGEQMNQFKRRMYESTMETLLRHVDPTGKTLLDIGCSWGGFMEVAREAGFEVTGYDLLQEAVNRVNQAGMRAQCCTRIADFTLTDEQFDVISVLDANFYWPNQPEELKGIHARLKPGGLLVMRVADKSWMARMGAALQNVSPAKAETILRRAVNDHRFSMPIRSFLRL